MPRAPHSRTLLAGRPRAKRSVFSSRMSRIRSIPLSRTEIDPADPATGCRRLAVGLPDEGVGGVEIGRRGAAGDGCARSARPAGRAGRRWSLRSIFGQVDRFPQLGRVRGVMGIEARRAKVKGVSPAPPRRLCDPWLAGDRSKPRSRARRPKGSYMRLQRRSGIAIVRAVFTKSRQLPAKEQESRHVRHTSLCAQRPGPPGAST